MDNKDIILDAMDDLKTYINCTYIDPDLAKRILGLFKMIEQQLNDMGSDNASNLQDLIRAEDRVEGLRDSIRHYENASNELRVQLAKAGIKAFDV
jgi:hypothetical protein